MRALSGARPQPSKLLQEAKARIVDEAATLSYEQALRRHSRRRPVEEPDMPGPPNEKLSTPRLQKEAVSKSASQVAGHAKQLSQASPSRRKVERAATSPGQLPASQSPGQSLNPSQTQSSLQSRAKAGTRKPPSCTATPRTKSQTLSKRQEGTKPDLRASGEQIGRRAKPSSKPQQAESAQQPLQRPKSPSIADKALELRRAVRENLQLDHQSTEKSGTRRASAEVHAGPLVSQALARQERATLEPKPAQESSQRRTILSLRLSEEESEQLKLRAAESGISVSAYMRSCVLDAEHLRTQVKQALNEMRLSIRRSEPASTMQLTTQSSTTGGTWFSVITRTAALFLAPLFSMRQRS